MGMKNIFHRWMNGLLGSKATTEKESPPGLSYTEQQAHEWWVVIQRHCIEKYGVDWNPLEKTMWLMGLNDCSIDNQTKFYKMCQVDKPVGVNNFSQINIVLVDEWLPKRPFTREDEGNALKLWLTLNRVRSSLKWQRLEAMLFPPNKVDLLDHYLRRQLGIDLSGLDEVRKALLVWSIVGRPPKPSWDYLQADKQTNDQLYANYYDAEITKLWDMINAWGIVSPSCKKPTLKEKPTLSKEKKDVVFIQRQVTEGNAKRTQWFVKTDKGEFPVKMGGEPEDMDILVSPFYRFEPGPLHGMNSCQLRIASGTKGQYWFIRVTKGFDIYSVQDNDRDHMECFTLPGDSPALSLFKIDCPLKSILK